MLASRTAQLCSMRARRRIASGLERVTTRRDRPVLSAAIPFDWKAVQLARPALEQLAVALRSRQSVRPRGVVLTRLLLTEPSSPLYRPAYAEELYEVAREALFALGPEAAGAGGAARQQRVRGGRR
jgi:hypothetical protein